MSIPPYLEQRIRRAVPSGSFVVESSTPVPAFGNYREATLATVGINPSRREFFGNDGLLRGESRRLSTMESLGVEALADAPADKIAEVVDDCNRYFGRNPYTTWFNPLNEIVFRASGRSYFDGTACHLDLVQWAKDPVWRQIKNAATRSQLINQDRTFLKTQLMEPNIQIVLLNGATVVKEFAQSTDLQVVSMPPLERGKLKTRIYVAKDGGTRFVAWSMNIQAAHGITRDFRLALGERVAVELEQLA